MLVGYDVVGSPSFHEVDNVFGTEILLHRIHGLQHDEQLLLAVDLGLRVQAVVAVAAVVGFIFLAEIVEEHFPPAYRRLGIGSRLLEQLPPDILFGHRLSLHELLQFLEVLVRVEGDALTLTAIAPRASCFLVVSLQALGYVVMDDEPHVGFVDTHTEGYGGDDDVDFLHEEIILGFRPFGRLQSGVVGRGLDIIGAEVGSQFLHFLSGEAVYDAALSGILLDETNDLLVDLVGLWPHLIIQVGPVERTVELFCIDNAKAFLDIGAHLVGGGGGKRDDRSIADFLDGGPDVPVFGSEVMSPFRDTVRLVDSIE